MLIIMKKYSRIIFLVNILLTLVPDVTFSAEPPKLGDPLSQSMSLKTENIIGLSSYKRLIKPEFRPIYPPGIANALTCSD